MDVTIVGTSLTPGGRFSHRGFVDVVDCLQGVRGWALNLAALDEPPLLELLVGAVVLGEVTPDQPRHDISEVLDTEVSAGFLFPPSVLALAAELAASGDDVISVRVAGTAMALGSADEPARAGHIVDQLSQLATPGKVRSHTADLELLLDDLRAEAVDLAEQHLRPLPENHQGYVETLAIDTSGQVWLIGWMKRGHLTEFSAVISERRKVPAAVALMTYTRDDLPPDACGVIGLLSSSWRPSSPHSEFHLYFGNGGRFFLLAHVPLRLITAAELAAEYEGVRERMLGEGRAIALQRMLTALDSWMPTRSAGQAYGTETSLDCVLLVPGMGCLVEGWLLSPLKRVEGLRLRIGGAVMIAKPETITWKPRQDLLDSYPGSERLIPRAGYVAMFTGDAEPDDFTDPMLKIVFQGGASASWSASPQVFRTLGHSATVEDALRFYPALEDEGFFPDFAKAAVAASLSGMAPPVPVKIARSPTALVIVLPEDRCDLFLLFEDLAQQARTGLTVDGLVLVASSAANRAETMWMFQEFQRDLPIAASLVLIGDTEHGFAHLPEILRLAGVQHFVFLGPSVFLTASGWNAVRTIAHGASAGLHFLCLEADDFDRQQGGHGATARCFAWSTPPFVRWSLGAGKFLGGFHRENGLLRSGVAHHVHPDAARNSRWTVPTRIQDAVNAAIYDMKAMG